jgi:hypothetical protein
MTDNNYSLKNNDLFYKNLNADTHKIIQLYSELMIVRTYQKLQHIFQWEWTLVSQTTLLH